MECPRCHKTMTSDLDMGRNDQGSCRALTTQTYRCIYCGTRVYPEQVPVMKLAADIIKSDAVKQCNGGRKVGCKTSAAQGVAVEFFESICEQRRCKTGWSIITRLLRQATGKIFSKESMEYYWTQEKKRRDTAQVKKQQTSAAGKASAARRKEASP